MLLSDTAVIIGNGPSRLGLDLRRIKFVTYGCNALIRDYTPNWIGACDYGIRAEIERSGQIDKGNIVWQYRWDEFKHYSTGHMMTRFAIEQHGVKNIVLVGIDCSTYTVYEGTDNYFHCIKEDKPENNWFTTWMGIINDHPNVLFFRVGEGNLFFLTEIEFATICT